MEDSHIQREVQYNYLLKGLMSLLLVNVLCLISYVIGISLTLWLKRDKTEIVNLNDLAIKITKLEGKNESMNNAQTKELMRILFTELSKMNKGQINYILKRYRL